MQRTKDKVRGSGGVVLTLLVAVLALVLTCRKWDNPLDPTGNHPPVVPKYPSPPDSSIRINVGLVLSWHSYDPDSGDTAYFRVFFDTVSSPRMVKDSCTDTTYQPTNVSTAKRYYWQVIAYDNHGDSAVGPVWQFTTAASISVTAPDSGQQLRINSQDTITWTGGPPAVDSTVLYRSLDDGASWDRLGRATAAGQFVWQVPTPATGSARVKVKDYVLADTMAGISGRFEIQDTTSLGPKSPATSARRALGATRQ